MPAKTYTSNVDSEGRVIFTTYKVWFDGLIKSRTFESLDDAERSYQQGDGRRLDKVVMTVLRESSKDF